jgi:hypothetical protein
VEPRRDALLSRDELLSKEMRALGISFDYLMIYDDRLVFNHVSDITFELLEMLVTRFATRKIDIDCDTGTGSDPGHDRGIIVWNPKGIPEKK